MPPRTARHVTRRQQQQQPRVERESAGVFYERVGCRLCLDGQQHDTEQCNGQPHGTLASKSSIYDFQQATL